MPKSYKLKTPEELLRIAEKQNRKDDGTEPIDWAHEAAVEDILKFFIGNGVGEKEYGPGDSEGESSKGRPG